MVTLELGVVPICNPVSLAAALESLIYIHNLYKAFIFDRAIKENTNKYKFLEHWSGQNNQPIKADTLNLLLFCVYTILQLVIKSQICD